MDPGCQVQFGQDSSSSQLEQAFRYCGKDNLFPNRDGEDRNIIFSGCPFDFK
jgi:hypothetical protein